MIHITTLSEGLELFKALGSDVRVEILNLLLANEQLSMNQLATRLNITNGALTSHIKKLEDCGLISITSESAGHGNQKLCSIMQDKIIVEFEKPIDYSKSFSTNVKIGHYSDFHVAQACGLASSRSVVGEIDDARFFDHPDRFNADILWFSKGYVEYPIINLIPEGCKITQINISMEVSSKSSGIISEQPSDITFYLNGMNLGTWTSPGEFYDVKGTFTPDWWPANWNQYGLLKQLIINKKGTYIDGSRISDVNTQVLNLDSSTPLRFRLSVEDDAANIGGITLFGKHFGNFGQDMKVILDYAKA